MTKLFLHKTVATVTLSTMVVLSGTMVRGQEPWKPEIDAMKLTARQADSDCGFHCIELQVFNNSDSQAIVVDASSLECENQHASLPEQIFSAVSKAEKDNRKRERALAFIATAGLGCMLEAEHEEKKEGSLAWLGDQTKDRKLRCRIFTRRVIGPGDNTAGRIYFKRPLPDAATLKIPAMFVSQYGESNEILTVPLSGTTINPITQNPSSTFTGKPEE